MPHQFSTGKPMRLVDISVDNYPENFLRVFLAHTLLTANWQARAGAGELRNSMLHSQVPMLRTS
jgi:hypothetical protein